ncbi:MAG: SRPBCC family protein [Myxococcota bacterium]
MSNPKNTVTLHRVFSAPPERVYRAFLDPDAIVKWFPPHGFTCKVHQMDPNVGGTYRMSFTNFSTGKSHAFGGSYQELVPGQKIRYTDKFEDPSLPGEMPVTVAFKEVICGTEMHLTQENIPEAIPVEMCYLGWQECMTQLALVVEPDVNEDLSK